MLCFECYELHKDELIENWKLCKNVFLNIIDAEYVDEYKISVLFSNGNKGVTVSNSH